MNSSSANAIIPGATNPQIKCRLMGLPAELRNGIYQFVLTLAPDDRDHVAISDRPSSYGGTPPGSTVLSLLWTCRQVNDEALGFFYSLDRLRIMNRHRDPWHDTIRFLHSLGPARRQAKHLGINLRNVSCRSNVHTFTMTLQTLERECVNLTSLHVYLVDSKRERISLTLRTVEFWSDKIREGLIPSNPRFRQIDLKMNAYWGERFSEHTRQGLTAYRRMVQSKGRVASSDYFPHGEATYKAGPLARWKTDRKLRGRETAAEADAAGATIAPAQPPLAYAFGMYACSATFNIPGAL
ncbi:hypothetical protein LTR53_004246 [Teratosphaeriaceae sp. CCFEE 6253]|nr:hypothetical protein LTR53_004246 [Teratosphaeriaceae sp. CCFEE 6253]